MSVPEGCPTMKDGWGGQVISTRRCLDDGGLLIAQVEVQAKRKESRCKLIAVVMAVVAALSASSG